MQILESSKGRIQEIDIIWEMLLSLTEYLMHVTTKKSMKKLKSGLLYFWQILEIMPITG